MIKSPDVKHQGFFMYLLNNNQIRITNYNNLIYITFASHLNGKFALHFKY